MIQDFPRRAELLELLGLLRDGEVTAEQIAQIEEIVHGDERATAIYVKYVHLGIALHYRVGKASGASVASSAVPICSLSPYAFPPAVGTVSPSICGQPAEGHEGEPGDAEGHLLPATPPKASPAPRLLASLRRPKFGYASRYAITLSILISVMLLGGLVVVVRSAILRRGNSEVARVPISTDNDAAVKPVVVARLAKAVGCRWTNAKTVLPVGSELLAGQKLDLATGEAEIVFGSGAVVVLRGATMLEIESAGSVRLLLGRVTARAETEAAHGFTVHTRTACLTDLGTQFDVQAAADGRSGVYVTVGAVEVRADGGGAAAHRLEAGESAQIEPGDSGAVAIIESGDGTAAFKFPTIEPPSDHDYADASQKHATVRLVEGKVGPDSGPVDVLLDGRGQSKADAPRESFFFYDNFAGKILVDLGKPVLVRKINTYSWHVYEKAPLGHDMRDVRATQRYALYGYSGDTPPPAAGDPASHGWTLISRVDTDEFFTVPPVTNRPPQQGVSITGNNRKLGRYRFLLWAVQPTHAESFTSSPEMPPADQNTFFGEFDVYAE